MHISAFLHFNRTIICLALSISIVFCYLIYQGSADLTDDVGNNVNKIDLQILLKYAIKAAQNGGKEVLGSKDNLVIKSKGLTKEGMLDSVTTADLLSHCSMTKTVQSRFPTLNVLSEEAETKCSNDQFIDLTIESQEDLDHLNSNWVDEKDVTVWIDPLDATYEFSEKLYQYVTTMVCVALRGKPIIGVIHQPFDKTTSWAWVGEAKSQDLLGVIKKNNNGTLQIAISRSHRGKIESILNNHLKDYNLIIAAGAGYKALLVAKGKADAYLHVTAIKKWDVCAGNAIIAALGGQMTTKFDVPINYADTTNVINMDGIIADLDKHKIFLGKL